MKKMLPCLMAVSMIFISSIASAQDVTSDISNIDLNSASGTVFIILMTFLVLKCASDILTKIAVRTTNTADNKIAGVLAKVVLLSAKIIDQFIGNSRASTLNKKLK